MPAKLEEKKVKMYSEKEERLNIKSHALGIFLSTIASILLLVKGITSESLIEAISFVVFGLSMIVLYTASTLYHSARNFSRRKRLRVFDHASIYVLIAGTYTPFTLLVIAPQSGYWLFYAIWAVAIFGIVLKIFYTGRFDILSTILYVIMGWFAVFEWNTLMEHLPSGSWYLLIGGGIVYTLGAILYSIKLIPYNHFIFHLCVLVGTICHFSSVYLYL
jgi:hemolysin III